MDEISIYTDGGSRGNPGMSACAFLFVDEDGKIVHSHAEFLGEGTNNQAEYGALILALEEAVKLGVKKVSVFSDSELVIKHMTGEYKLKAKELVPLNEKVRTLIAKIKKVEFHSVPRENHFIAAADMLVNLTLDASSKKRTK